MGKLELKEIIAVQRCVSELQVTQRISPAEAFLAMKCVLQIFQACAPLLKI